MGCLKLKYLENPSPLKVVYRAHEAEQKPAQGFWSLDPLGAKYAYNSPYAFTENDVIRAVELEGLGRRVIINYVHITKDDKRATVKVDKSTVTHNVLEVSSLQHGVVAATLEFYGVKLKGPDYYGTQTVNVATYSDGTYSASSTYEDSKSEFIDWTKSLGSNNKRDYKGIPSDGDVFDEGDHDYNPGSGGKMDPDENPEGYGGFGSGSSGSGNNWFAPPPSKQWQQNPIVPQLEDQIKKQSGDGYYYYREKSTGDTVKKSRLDLTKTPLDTTGNKYNLKTNKIIEAEYEFYKGDKKK